MSCRKGLESEQSVIETERRLAEQRTAQQEELARQKHQLEIRRIELEGALLPRCNILFTRATARWAVDVVETGPMESVLAK